MYFVHVLESQKGIFIKYFVKMLIKDLRNKYRLDRIYKGWYTMEINILLDFSRKRRCFKIGKNI